MYESAIQKLQDTFLFHTFTMYILSHVIYTV